MYILLSCKHFHCVTGFCKKKINFSNLQFFWQVLKVEHRAFHSSFVIFGHQAWDLEGGWLIIQVPNLINLSYVVELPTVSSNLNH